jgi:hypothetical protein
MADSAKKMADSAKIRPGWVANAPIGIQNSPVSKRFHAASPKRRARPVRYLPDNGPLSRRHASAIRRLQPRGRMRVIASLF